MGNMQISAKTKNEENSILSKLSETAYTSNEALRWLGCGVGSFGVGAGPIV